MKRKILFLCIISLFAIFLFSGCNILGWSHDNDNVEDKLSDAKYEMEEGNYEEARSLFNEVLEKQPNNSKALWGYAKARMALQITLDDILEIGKRLDGDEYAEGTPLIEPKDFSFNNWSEVVDFLDTEIIPYLDRIYAGDTDGVIDTTDVSLNVSTGIMYFLSGSAYLLDSPITAINEETGEPVEFYLELSWKKDNPNNPNQKGPGTWDVRTPEGIKLDTEQLDPDAEPFPETVRKINIGATRLLQAIEYTDVTNKKNLRDIHYEIETIQLDVAFFDF